MNKNKYMEKPPTISKELVQWLDHNFPVVQPKMQDTDREIFYKVGQRSVIDHLQSVFNEQNENILR
tara:strand:- start:3327 stop:3524 length:198 start_codon:yes stop_codon:yes gene_type:complete